METSPIAKQKVLIADDDQYIRRAYSFGLKKEGFEVLAAENGAEVIAMTRDSHPDLILLDQMMPIMNGFETLKTLKNDPLSRDIPVIVFSNLEQPTDRAKALELGAVDYIVKSDMSMKDVMMQIRSHLKQK